MLEHITQTVMKALFVQNRKMKMATGHLFVSLTLPSMVKVLMEHGEEAQMILTDTGSLMMMALLATGSARMAK